MNKIAVEGKKKGFLLGLGILVLAILLIIIFTVASAAENTPTESVEKFTEAAIAGEMETAKKYVTDDVLTVFASGRYGTFSGWVREEFEDHDKVEVIEEEIEGNYATVEVKRISIDGEEREDTWHMIKEDDVWKISE